MRSEERRALESLAMNWALTPDDVWRDNPYHVNDLYPRTLVTIMDGVRDATESSDTSPLGLAILGQNGAGKTHLLGWVREQVQARGGYFFLISLLDAGAFWHSSALSVIYGICRTVTRGETQLQVLLRRLCLLTGTPHHSHAAVIGEAPLTRGALDSFIEALRAYDRLVGLECQDTARALVLLGSPDFDTQDIGMNYLQSQEEMEQGERGQWGMRRGTRSAQQIVQDVSKLLALTGPTVMAVDQVDVLIAQSAKPTGESGQDAWRQGLLLEQVAGGLMSMREVTRRTLSVVACLPLSWELITTKATVSVRDRFRVAEYLRTIPSAEAAQEMIAKRFAVHYAQVGFMPPYPTWPVAPQAFREAPNFTPRHLLARVDDHVRSCLYANAVAEMATIAAANLPSIAHPSTERVSGQDLSTIDARFEVLKAEADGSAGLDPSREDAVMPGLIQAGLNAWIDQLDTDNHGFRCAPHPGARPAVHARLVQALDHAIEDEYHWSFRAISTEAAPAVLARIKAAVTFAGLDADVPKRRLFILRAANKPWSQGARTRDAIDAFQRAGGLTLPIDASDLATLQALQGLYMEGPPGLTAWLRQRRPTSDINFLRVALPDPETATIENEFEQSLDPAAKLAGFAERADPEQGPAIDVGQLADGTGRATVPLETLRTHVAIFAGSGSGKTVLLRRIIEEAALNGVSSIVLDPNNDLATLGDPWPERPQQWDVRDAEKAAEYLANTEVIVWTPQLAKGRPLAFPALMDFTGLLEDPDEFDLALDVAVAALAPHAGADGETARAIRGRAILHDALKQFVVDGGHRLKDFVDMLADLPDRVSTAEGADKAAAEMAYSLTAAIINDPVFAGDDTSLDPGVLLKPTKGKRARVSVISFAGLPADHQRLTFVTQLQTALFSWIKRNPAGEEPLRGLLVMEEAQVFAGAGKVNASTQTTLALASQARRYGIGMIFATQAPRGLSNRVPGNAATQFFGLLNSPLQIATAREIAQVKRGDIPDISRMRTGQFYATIGGNSLQRIRADLCLSHHPIRPLARVLQ